MAARCPNRATLDKPMLHATWSYPPGHKMECTTDVAAWHPTHACSITKDASLFHLLLTVRANHTFTQWRTPRIVHKSLIMDCTSSLWKSQYRSPFVDVYKVHPFG